VGDQLTAEVARAIGQAVATLGWERLGRAPRLAVGRDNRPSGPALAHGLLSGIEAVGGHSMIVDHRGAIVGKQLFSNGSTFVTGVVNIEALRHHRQSAQVTNWAKDIRTELAQIVYEKPIYPKNLYLKRAPMKHAEYREKVIRRQIRLMHDRDIWKRPAR